MSLKVPGRYAIKHLEQLEYIPLVAIIGYINKKRNKGD